MAIVPLKQRITVTKANGHDGWGRPLPGEVLTLKARVTEETEIVTNQAGKEAKTTATIFLDKLADVSYDDVIEYTNELGVTIKRPPIRIEIKRGIGGKPLLTVVYV